MYHLHKKISHTSQPEACHLRMTKTKVNLIQILVRFPGSENFLSILTLKALPNKYDSNYEITFSENPMHPIFLKSIIIKSVYFPDSKLMFILLVNNVK